MKDNWDDATGASRVAIGLAGIAFVTNDSARFYVGANVEKYQKIGAIKDFSVC